MPCWSCCGADLPTGVCLCWAGYAIFWSVGWRCGAVAGCRCGFAVRPTPLLITALEFVTGCLVNLHLGWDVWDYATQPLNLMGQVCIGFSALWFLLSVPVSGLSLAMLKSLQKRMVLVKTEG